MIDEAYLYSNKCRLCLCNEKFQIPIFGEVAEEKQIYLKIRTCLSIKVSQEDDFPKSICYKCVAALEQSYNLWRVSSESEAVLRNLTSKANQDLSEVNMQHQGCHSFRSKGPSQANRRLLLPTGISLILESDSEEEHGQAAEMDSLETRPAADRQETAAWLWESGSVLMDTTPDFLDLLSEPSPRSARQTSHTEMMNSSPHVLECLSQPAPNIRDMTTKESSPSSRWRSISLFGKSANTWRDLLRHREAREERHRIPGSPSIMTEGVTAASQPVDSRSREDVLKAMNERNCKAIGRCGDMPSTLLNFLQTQKPLVHEDPNIPRQGPK
ncbi:uncharacterized protein LOC110838942 [Zootermopsis nevadensis]|uniref:ZAD domain-containing protein n=1 Tax=Zootermopsis nevadensis TaxID=136037 RepID=A0A067QWV0_ZOONE|nr:uncharacterized protein LOC110838942 [Zootermopsis nevadensis]KDR09141.1 hypothetical protein L798_01256 [Zootermopsis nevadensis]